MRSDLNKTKLRAIQYYYIDGTFEFTFGGLCLLLGGYFFLEASVPEGALSAMLSMAFVLIIVGGSTILNRLVKGFKEQVTYPRTGYVDSQRRTGKDRILRIGFVLGLSAIIGGILAALITRSSQVLDWMPGLTAFVFGIIWGWIGFHNSLPRFQVIGLVIILIGAVLSISGVGYSPGLSLFYMLTGLVMLISGGFTLWSYLHHNPPSDEAADEP